MGDTLIFDWKLQLFNESRIVAWKRIVPLTNTLIQEWSPVPMSPWVLLIEKSTTVCLYISEQMVINEHFLLCHRECSSIHQKLLFCSRKKGGEGQQGGFCCSYGASIRMNLWGGSSLTVSETDCFRVQAGVWTGQLSGHSPCTALSYVGSGCFTIYLQK